MSSSSYPLGNHLLEALADWGRWAAQLEWVELPAGKVLCEPDRAMSHVVFPVSANVSLMGVTASGASAEIALVGHEGVIGVQLFMGGDTTPIMAVARDAGHGWRLDAQTIRSEFERHGEIRRLLLRYVHALMTQMSQTVACNRHHSVDQRLCRSLLLSLDRLQGSDLVTTQELIAKALGVRRQCLTSSTLRLRKAGLIGHARGRISVLDRAGLERRACECYAVIRKEYDRLLPLPLAA